MGDCAVSDFGDRLVSTLDHTLEPKVVRRIEVITGVGGRRRFPDEEKARIIEETFAPGAVVSAIARQNGLTPQQLFTWRRQAQRRLKGKRDEAPLFVPAVVEKRIAVSRKRRKRAARLTPEADRRGGVIEIEAGGMTVRIGRGVDAKLATAVIMALKAAK
jgi:transposase